MYVGYGSIVAERGAIGVTVQHQMDTLAHCRSAAEEVAAGVELARTLPGVDRDRVALWFFSGGGLLTTDWLRDPPSWLTCIALTYPVLDTVPEWGVDPHVDPVGAIRSVGRLPILLTKVGESDRNSSPASTLSSRPQRKPKRNSTSSTYPRALTDSTCSTIRRNHAMQ